MNISTTLVLFLAEFILLLILLTVFLIFYIRKLKARTQQTAPQEEKQTVDLSSSYTDFLDQELLKHDEQAFQGTFPEDDNNEEHSAEDRKKFLDIRYKLLNIEKSATENTDNEQAFWEAIYSGIKEISSELTVIQEAPTDNTATPEPAADDPAIEDPATKNMSAEEKIIYIETQSKKSNDEFNKLKDIISAQEYTLSDLQKALGKTKKTLADGTDLSDAPEFIELLKQTANLERQISDSKMCMQVLELENSRLQTEVDDLKRIHQDQEKVEDLSSAEEQSPTDQNNDENSDQIKDSLKKQEQEISKLKSTINQLESSVEAAGEFEGKLAQISQNNKEMEGCIVILEDENDFLSKQIGELLKTPQTSDTPDTDSDEKLKQMQDVIHQQEQQISELGSTIEQLNNKAAGVDNLDTDPAIEVDDASDEEITTLKSKIKQYEKDIIKKDVAYAKIHDELASMEKEFQAMYEQIHNEE